MSEQRTSNSENSVPTRDEGTTFDCETCRDTGEVDMTLGGYSTSDPHAKCPDCRSEERMKEQFTSNERTQQLRYPDAWGDTALLKRNAKWAADELDRQRAEIERLESDLAAEKALRAEAESFAEDRERHTALVVRGGAEIIAERDRLRAALLNHVCNCGPTDPDPSVHREDCAYRLALSGEHASAHETTARRMTRAEADAMNRAFWRSVEIIDDIDDREEVAPGDARYYRPSENPSICPYGQSDCETTRGGVCQCAMPAEQASDGRD